MYTVTISSLEVNTVVKQMGVLFQQTFLGARAALGAEIRAESVCIRQNLTGKPAWLRQKYLGKQEL